MTGIGQVWHHADMDGKRVKRLRTRLGLTQVEMAKMLKVALRTYKRYESLGVLPVRVADHIKLVAEREGVRV